MMEGQISSWPNSRWAVRYIPQMLEGPDRVWLNNLPPGSINSWIDFHDAFVSNFTSTYKRPNRPQQLAMCNQRPNETDREFLTRWCMMRNSYEGVIESQAIAWFAQGCRYAMCYGSDCKEICQPHWQKPSE